jgi:hypothetical protein
MREAMGSLSRDEHLLLQWLAAEDHRAYGECYGRALDRLMDLRLVEWKTGQHPRGDAFRRVGLTEAGYAYAKRLKRAAKDAKSPEQQ